MRAMWLQSPRCTQLAKLTKCIVSLGGFEKAQEGLIVLTVEGSFGGIMKVVEYVSQFLNDSVIGSSRSTLHPPPPMPPPPMLPREVPFQCNLLFPEHVVPFIKMPSSGMELTTTVRAEDSGAHWRLCRLRGTAKSLLQSLFLLYEPIGDPQFPTAAEISVPAFVDKRNMHAVHSSMQQMAKLTKCIVSLGVEKAQEGLIVRTVEGSCGGIMKMVEYISQLLGSSRSTSSGQCLLPTPDYDPELAALDSMPTAMQEMMPHDTPSAVESARCWQAVDATPVPCNAYCKMLLPTDIAGAFIGRDGSHIHDMEKRSGCQIHISSTGLLFPGTNSQICVMGGTISQLESCISMMISFIRRVGCVADKKLLLQLAVPTSAVSRIIGYKGSIVQTLRNDTGCHIDGGPRVAPLRERLGASAESPRG